MSQHSSPRPPTDDNTRTLVQGLNTHYHEIVVPIWKSHGFNAALALPFEAVLASGSAIAPVRYRAMACARQLFVFSEAGDKAHAEQLFHSLMRHFKDREHGGFFYSVDAGGQPRDTQKDLYTHAFVIFACSAYLARFDDTAALSVIMDTADVLAKQFSVDASTGLTNAAMTADFKSTILSSQQNPLMHLTEAYLLARAATGDVRFDKALMALLGGITDHFVDSASHCIMELPTQTPNSWIEPGHQFEWFFLAYGQRHPAFAATGLDAHLLVAFDFAQSHGVDKTTGGVAASLDPNGHVIDANQRIWAQTEYLRALACHPDSAIHSALAWQIDQFQQRFLHRTGWYECIGHTGEVTRADMPSTTPYHLRSAYSVLLVV